MYTLSGIWYFGLSALARVLPPTVAYLFGETLATVCFLLSSSRRKNLAANLRVVLGDPDLPQFTMTALHVMLNFARCVTDVFMIPGLDDKRLRTCVSITGREHLDRAASRGKGVILVTAHVGSWEMGGVALAGLGYRITTVAGVQFTRGLSPYVKAMKESRGIDVVSVDGGALAMARALRRGEIVALHIDGDQYLGGIEVNFFGRPTVLPRGPAGLAMTTGAAIIPAFAISTARGKIRVCIEDEIGAEGHDEAGLTARIAAVVEDCIRRHVDQWCMFRPIWEAER